MILKTTRAANLMTPSSPATQSPMAKRGRNGQNDKENARFIVFKIFLFFQQSFDQNSPTVCGTHFQAKNKDFSFLTSTPEITHKTASKFTSDVSDLHKPRASIDFGVESPDPIQQLLSGQNRRRTIGLFEKDPDWRRTSKVRRCFLLTKCVFSLSRQLNKKSLDLNRV
jgi:hypothetical protein